ncbi:MAG: hypothetical protein ABL907_16135 [Hyphomicrobium sp.]
MSPTPRKLGAEAQACVARYALAMLRWQWFPDADLPHNPAESRPVARLMLGLFLAQAEKKQLTKSEACALMGVDSTTTGPRYFAALEQEDWIEIVAYPSIDKRKDFLRPTLKLTRAVEKELLKLARNLVHFGDHLDDMRRWAGVDTSSFRDAPPGEPGRSLAPVAWPPEHVGTVIASKTLSRKA